MDIKIHHEININAASDEVKMGIDQVYYNSAYDAKVKKELSRNFCQGILF